MPLSRGCVSCLCVLVQCFKKKGFAGKCKMSQMSAQMIHFHCKIHSSWLFLPILSSPFSWFSLPQNAWQKNPIMWGVLPLILELSVLKSHSRPRGKRRRRSCVEAVISEARFDHTTSIWSHKSILQQSCHITAAEVWQSKLVWCCGILSEAQYTNGGV